MGFRFFIFHAAKIGHVRAGSRPEKQAVYHRVKGVFGGFYKHKIIIIKDLNFYIWWFRPGLWMFFVGCVPGKKIILRKDLQISKRRIRQFSPDAGEGLALDTQVGGQVGQRNPVKQIRELVDEIEVSGFGAVKKKTFNPFLLKF